MTVAVSCFPSLRSLEPSLEPCQLKQSIPMMNEAGTTTQNNRTVHRNKREKRFRKTKAEVDREEVSIGQGSRWGMQKEE